MNKAPNENQIEENLEKQISSFNNYLGNFESFRCMKMKEYYKKYIDMTITHYQQFINDFNQYITGNEIIYSEIIKQKISENEKYVYAISNYKSKEPSDLCFKRGTKIKLLKKNENGWWEGELKNGKVGLFPSTYVFFKEDNSKTYIGETFLLMENFKPQNSQEIKIETGDFVQVKFITSTQGYGMNLMTKKEGFFPLSLIDVVPDDDEDK